MDQGAFSLPPALPAQRPAHAAPKCAAWAKRASTVTLVASIVLAVAIGAAAALGIRTEVVLTGSMQPTLSPGDMLVVRGITAAEMRVGDIVSFAAPDQQGVVITHRVRKLHTRADGRIAVVTQGDANNTPERWTISPRGSVARVVQTIPGVGKLTDWTHDPLTRTIVFLVLGAALLAGGLRWVWKDR